MSIEYDKYERRYQNDRDVRTDRSASTRIIFSLRVLILTSCHRSPLILYVPRYTKTRKSSQRLPADGGELPVNSPSKSGPYLSLNRSLIDGKCSCRLCNSRRS